jgi:hypothetical protein
MELTVSVEELRKKKLFVATPCYGGMCNGLYTKSCLDLQAMCAAHGIEIKFSFLFNESLITRARAYLADEFIRSGCTHMLFIDSDIHFEPSHVLTLLAMDKDISGAPYPKKSINWRNIKAAVERWTRAKVSEEMQVSQLTEVFRQNHPDVDPATITPQALGLDPAKMVRDLDAGELAALVGEYVFNPVAGTVSFSVTEPLKVMEIGTGFMMIKRGVFDTIKEAFPSLSYKPDHAGQANFDGSRYIHMYFPCIIDSKDSETGGGSDRYLSEDYAFCQLCRKVGYDIWLAPWMRLGHIGTYEFQGDLARIANTTGNL